MKMWKKVTSEQEVEVCDRDGCEGHDDVMYVTLRATHKNEAGESVGPYEDWEGILCGKCRGMIFARINGKVKRTRKKDVATADG